MAVSRSCRTLCRLSLLMLSPGNNARLQSMEDGAFLGHFPSVAEIYFATLLTQLPFAFLACVFCIYRIVKSGVLKKDAGKA